MFTGMNDDALFPIRMSEYFGTKEYNPMFDDIIRFVSIQCMIQFMMTLMDNQAYAFFSIDFLVLLLFIIIGVMFYWLIFKKLFSFQ